MQVEVVMPKMGESIQEGKILRWAKKVGDKIQKDETILEISTDKVDSEIPSAIAGVLARIVVAEQETVPVGTVIAYVETDVNARIQESHSIPASPAQASAHSVQEVSDEGKSVSSVASSNIRNGNGDRFYSPLVRTIAKSEGLSNQELESIQGSGSGGRITKTDVLSYLQRRSVQTAVPKLARAESGTQKVGLADVQKKYPSPQYRIQQMDNVQLKMAEHMVRSVATSAHVGAIDEADVTPIVHYRNLHAEAFEKKQGFKLTFTPFFAHAVVETLKEFPIVNCSLEGDKIIIKNFINLGIAVASPTGLIVPNIQRADEKNFLGLARAINDLSVRTRNKKLSPDEVQGGTFTITNFGVFGTIIGTPIINQPQVAILGIGAIKKRPVVITDESGSDSVGIRSMVYVSLSFDHRIIDGAIGGQFLAKIRSQLENFDFQKNM